MSRGSLNIGNTSFDFHVTLDQINAGGSVDSPILNIPLRLELGPYHRTNKSSFYEITVAKGELFASERKIKVSEKTNLLSYRIHDNQSMHLNLSFLLNQEIINSLEKLRKTNLDLQLELQLQYAVYERLTLTAENAINVITHTQVTTGTVSFTIDQSYWINNLLNKLGNKTYTLIELPSFNTVIPEEYKKSLAEFEKANKFMKLGEYDSAVAHCRAALDPFKEKTKLEKLKEFIRSKSEYQWATGVLEATEEWLDKVIKGTFAFTSKAHHAPTQGHFSKTEAEIVLMITTGIIAYIGKIEFKPE